MKSNLFKVWTFSELDETHEEFDSIQHKLNDYHMKFVVVYFGTKYGEIGILVYQVEDGSKCDEYLRSKGFNEDMG